MEISFSVEAEASESNLGIRVWSERDCWRRSLRSWRDLHSESERSETKLLSSLKDTAGWMKVFPFCFSDTTIASSGAAAGGGRGRVSVSVG